MTVTLEALEALEAHWLTVRAGRRTVSGEFYDWEPYPLKLFARLLGTCLPHVPPGNRAFLDAGCGIGTKCLLAAQAGLDAYGIDRVPELLAEAARLGVSAGLADVRDYDGYGDFGLVYVNHPLNCAGDCVDEAVLESRIHGKMAPGAVLLAVNYDLAPGCPAHDPASPCSDACGGRSATWREVARDGAWSAAWVKPGG